MLLRTEAIICAASIVALRTRSARGSTPTTGGQYFWFNSFFFYYSFAVLCLIFSVVYEL